MKKNAHTLTALNPIASVGTFAFYFFISLLFILLNLAFSETGKAQVKPGDFFIVNSKVKVYPVTDFESKAAGDKTKFLFAEANQKFTVIDVSETGLIQIQFWKFSTGPKEESLTRTTIKAIDSADKIFIDQEVNGKVFTITLKDLNEKCMPYFGHKTSFTFGAMTIPLKIRFGTETVRPVIVEEKLNIGLTPGIKFQFSSRKEQSVTFLMNIGISNVRTTTDTFNIGYTPSSDNEPALSGAFGLMYQHEKFQIGIISGQDWLLSDGAASWKYQGKRWIGIGIGFSFFGQGNGESNSGENK